MFRQGIVCLALVLMILAVYAQVYSFDFVNYDDNLYVTENKHTRDGLTWDNVRWAFTTRDASNWHPLNWLSYMLDVQVFGAKASAMHLVNVMFHVANTLLLFWLLRWMTGALWQSAFVAALFAIHPLHVESVAWIAERKDVLSTFFWLLTMAAYYAYVRRPGVVRYLLVLLAFALGLMAKPMLVTLPVVLLLLDYSPLGRLAGRETDAKPFWRRAAKVLAEKIPLFVLALGSSMMTVYAQRSGKSIAGLEVLSVSQRVANALASYFRYLVMTVWPSGLAVFYPHPGLDLAASLVVVSVVALVAISAGVALLGRRHPYLVLGWLWYLVTLLPVIGIVQVGAQGLADRYTYVPLIGIFIMAAWGIGELAARLRTPKPVLAIAAAGVIVASMICAGVQVSYWRDSMTLFRRALQVTTKNHLAHKNLGVALADLDRHKEAVPHYLKAIKLKPKDADLHYNLANALDELGKPDEAIEAYKKALDIAPDHVETLYNLGNLSARLGRYDEAEKAYVRALELRPDHLGVLINLGNALALQQRPLDAADLYRKALLLDPEAVDPYVNLGNALSELGKYGDAVEYYRKAIELEPEAVNARCNLGYALINLGKPEEAAEVFNEALRIDPENAVARENLENLQGRQGTSAGE